MYTKRVVNKNKKKNIYILHYCIVSPQIISSSVGVFKKLEQKSHT